MKRKKAEWHWGNWTFGFWFGKIGHKNHIGLDLGPFEIVWVEK